MSTIRRQPAMNVDQTMPDESMRSGDVSVVIDNIVSKRPITRSMSRALALTPYPTTPAARKSARKSRGSNTVATSPLRRSLRRASQATSSQPFSQPPPQLPSSQPEQLNISGEPTSISQEVAQVGVASQEALTKSGPSATVDNGASVPVLDPEPAHQSVPKPRVRLALPVFAVTLPGDANTNTEGESGQATVAPALDDLPDSSLSSIGTTNVTFDLSMPTSATSYAESSGNLSLDVSRVQHTLRRSARLSGISATSTVSSASLGPIRTVKTKANSKLNTCNILSTTLRSSARSKVKAPLHNTEDRASHQVPSTSLDPTTTTRKNKGKERALSPALSPPPTYDVKTETEVIPSKLRSLSPQSETVLMNLQHALDPTAKPLVKTLKRHADEPSTPSKRARFDSDPSPISAPASVPAPLFPRPARIRVRPPNTSSIGRQHGSFTGSHPPIVVKGPSSPSKQQPLMRRPAGPRMRVPVGQQPQRPVPPMRTLSLVRTGSYANMENRPAKQPRQDKTGQVVLRKIGASKPIVDSQIKIPDVLIGPGGRSWSPARTARPLSRLPVPVSGSRTESQVDPGTGSSGLSEGGVAQGSASMLGVPGTAPREPTPFETPASPASTTSTLLEDPPYLLPPPRPRQEPREQGEIKPAVAAARAMGFRPLTRTPRLNPARIMFDSQAPVLSSSMSEGSKELQRLVNKNTERNMKYRCTIELVKPSQRMSKKQKERAQRRSAAKDGDGGPSAGPSTSECGLGDEDGGPSAGPSTSECKPGDEDGGPSAGPSTSECKPGDEDGSPSECELGDEDEWTEQGQGRPRVQWARVLAHHNLGEGLQAPSAGATGRGCLARTYALDEHGNVVGPQLAESPESLGQVVVTQNLHYERTGFRNLKKSDKH